MQQEQPSEAGEQKVRGRGEGGEKGIRSNRGCWASVSEVRLFAACVASSLCRSSCVSRHRMMPDRQLANLHVHCVPGDLGQTTADLQL